MTDMIFTAKEVESMMQECAFKSVAKVLDMIRAEIVEYKDDKIIHAERNEMIDIVIDIINKYRNEVVE